MKPPISSSSIAKKTTKNLGSRAKLRAYFLQNLGRVMDSNELRIAAGNITEWARRVRELRNEEGYQILTHNDRSDLKPGEYVLISEKPVPAFQRNISKETRAFVLDRNGFTCQQCGAVAGEIHPYDPSRKTRLHIGHIIDKSAGGSDEPTNLRALCSICNEGSRNLTLDRPTAVKLLIQIRRASGGDQLEALNWLVKKFPLQSESLLKIQKEKG
ncbi:MAG: HNH endonuclease [Alphaproteobacteria bacterium]|nr:HNH endonuclease [Alphaproteobacteria bacterium]